jgi:uncharacterized protein YbbC (DUF1343 family)
MMEKAQTARKITLVIALVLTVVCSPTRSGDRVKVGLEVLLEKHLDLLQGKRIGIIANQTSLDAEGKHIVELLSVQNQIVALFGPEHGFMGKTEDTASIQQNNIYKDIKLYSLYGDYLTPTPSMLKDVDVLIYDIQDVGVKFYTYISNLFLAMTAAKAQNIPVIVLDRPNPVNATRVEGAITVPVYSSFVGVMPLPIRYGMTVGELADLFNNEPYGGFFLGIDLTVIDMEGYDRNMWYDETGFPWTPTSPNMPALETAVIYPGMCLMEGTNLSEGRGTESPFLTIGAPWIVAEKWLEALPEETLKGVEALAVAFHPQSIPEVVTKPKYMNEKCYGLQFRITDRNVFKPIPLAVALLCAARKLFPDQFQTKDYLDKLWGDESLRAMIEEGYDYAAILSTTKPGIARFLEIRKKYLRYD